MTASIESLQASVRVCSTHSKACQSILLLVNLVVFHADDGLPVAWGAAGAFPALKYLNLRGNVLWGQLPASWASAAAFPKVRRELAAAWLARLMGGTAPGCVRH